MPSVISPLASSRQICGPLGSIGGSPYKLFDDFTDSNGVLLSAHTMPVGPGWTVAAGTIDIQSNKADSTGTDPGADGWQAVADSGISDFTLNCKIKPNAANTDPGALFRWTDKNNFWLLSVNPFAGHLQLYERVGAFYTLRATGSAFTISSGTEYAVQVVCSGTSISATINGSGSVNFTSSSGQTKTVHGFRFNSSAETADDFNVL